MGHTSLVEDAVFSKDGAGWFRERLMEPYACGTSTEETNSWFWNPATGNTCWKRLLSVLTALG